MANALSDSLTLVDPVTAQVQRAWAQHGMRWETWYLPVDESQSGAAVVGFAVLEIGRGAQLTQLIFGKAACSKGCHHLGGEIDIGKAAHRLDLGLGHLARRALA